MKTFEINRDGRVVCAATKQLISAEAVAAMPSAERDAYGKTCYKALHQGATEDRIKLFS